MNAEELRHKIAAIGPPYAFFTEISPGLNVDLPSGRIAFTSAYYETDDPATAAALLDAPGVMPGGWAKALKEPEPVPTWSRPAVEPEPEPKLESWGTSKKRGR